MLLAAALDLLIVAPAALEAPLAPFVAHKEAELATRLVSLESALRGREGADDAERLKRFIFERWREEGLRYVLLVGDADTMPVRYMVLDRVTAPAFDYAFYPSDLYYGDVARADGGFDDWNARRDGFHAGYVGEVRGEKNKLAPINFDAIDYRPEIGVGRWPTSDPAEVRTIVEKTVRYERALASPGGRWARSAAFVVTGGWVDARAQLDGLAGRLPPGWRGEKRYYADGSGADGSDNVPRGTEAGPATGSPAERGAPMRRTPPPDEQSVRALLDAGTGFIVHAGHGADDRWEGSIGTASIAGLVDRGRPSILLSAGCSTARFAALPPYEAYVDAAGATHAGTMAGEVFTAPPPPPSCYQRGAMNPTGLGERLLAGTPAGAVAYLEHVSQ